MKIVILLLAAALLILGAVAVAAASDRTDRMPVAVFDLRRYMGTVSYTHLTLPTT